jgi:hypothetical protein
MTSADSIPQRIIQTGKTRELRLVEEAALAGLTALNPGWEHVYFADPDVESFIDREFPHYRPVFDGFRYPIQKFDFFRYLAVYRLGGFYFDLDVFFARGLSDLTTSSCVFPFEELTISHHLRQFHGMDWEIGNYGFGAAAGHPFLGAVIENCVRAQREPAWVAPMMAGIPAMFRADFEVLNTTGPGLVSRTLAERPDLARHVTVLFPDDVCDSRSWHHFGHYGVHLMAASWRTRGGILHRRLARFWENRTRRRQYEISQRLGKRRSLPLATPA